MLRWASDKAEAISYAAGFKALPKLPRHLVMAGSKTPDKLTTIRIFPRR